MAGLTSGSGSGSGSTSGRFFTSGLTLFLVLTAAAGAGAHYISEQEVLDEGSISKAFNTLETFVSILESQDDADAVGGENFLRRVKREGDERGVTNVDIRDAILQLLTVIRESNARRSDHEGETKGVMQRVLKKLKGSTDDNNNNNNNAGGLEKKIDNISTFLLRMNGKLETIDRRMKRGGGGGGGGGAGGGGRTDLLETLSQESFDILTLLPTYIENTKDAIGQLSKKTDKQFEQLEHVIMDDTEDEEGNSNGEKKSLVQLLRATEDHVLAAADELKEMVIESGDMADSLFERVNDGYSDMVKEIKGLSNVEKVLLDTADSVMDTKRKLEFSVQQIVFKVGELVEISGGKIDEQLKDQFSDITKTILSNQTEALANLTKKVEKEIGQVWRQMGIMYGQVSNSIKILEKVKESTNSYVSKTGKNLGQMEGQVEGLTDRMVDVDSNLNYMLGQLSLVVQEFNQVKTGLSDAMNGLGEELEEIEEFKPNRPRN